MKKLLSLLSITLLGLLLVGCVDKKPSTPVEEEPSIPLTPLEPSTPIEKPEEPETPSTPEEEEKDVETIDIKEEMLEHAVEYSFTIDVTNFTNFLLEADSTYSNGTAVYFTEINIDGLLLDIRNNEDFLSSSSKNMIDGTLDVDGVAITVSRLYKSTPAGFDDKYFALKGTNSDKSFISFDVTNAKEVSFTLMASTASQLKALGVLVTLKK